MSGSPPQDRRRVQRPEPRPVRAPLEPLIVILGPTGTGKTELAMAVAERIGGEVVGCDALQVYRGLDVGTAKPTAADRRRVPHHVVDHVPPTVDYTLADYVRDADAAVATIRRRGRTVVVAGGTGMYLRGLLRGLIAAPARDPARRARLLAIAERRGSARLHRWLARLDPVSADRLPPADRQRVVRALEFVLATGEPWSARLAREGTWSSPAERYRTVKIGLDLERDALSRRLDERVGRFFAAGWVDEVRALLDAGVPDSANAFKAIGYREIVTAIRDGRDPSGSDVIDAVRRVTRRFAKRQRTWFRSEHDVAWLDASSAVVTLADAVAERFERSRDA